ncbi:O-fucosyltransferase 36 [Rhodamnia argentea]|uniref:O-fucosyltransferase 36 n=1 Tax=Rhodamnia argentea TaxID=178133 RepID=A0ABM3GUQ2_9MYRT|nr:O-fucosyltransferase 36 [Rhodamnia argentea]
MERDSSDEDDDSHHLIHQNDTQPVSSTSRRHSAFDVEDLDSRIGTAGRFSFRLDKGYLLAIMISVLFLAAFFSADIRGLFSGGASAFKLDWTADRMRESELRALSLLKQQRLGLFGLWNHTFLDSVIARNGPANFTLSSSNSSGLKHDNDHLLVSSSALLEDFKSDVLRQIKLNKNIEEVLLLPHQSGNVSVQNGDGDMVDVSFGDFDFDRCPTVDQSSLGRKTIEWKPKPDKFLLAICVSGQMSNHLICLEKHMFFAAVLRRILIVPSSKVDYEYNKVLDVNHINDCLGRKVVMSFEEFSEVKKSHLHIDRFICYFSSPQHCYVDDEHVKKLKGLGISMGKLESPWVEDIQKPNKRTIQDVEAKFTVDDDMIAIGDVFFANLEQEWVTQPGGPLAHKCKTLIEPSRLIVLTAQRYIQTFLGKNYIALHFRRHGFLKFCNAKKPSCFYPVPQAAECIKRVVERVDAPVVYLSTDAAASETGLLQTLIFSNGKPVPLVKRPDRSPAEKWDALLYRHGLQDDPQVEAMLDKTICAMSRVFIGASGSTFTQDILRLRKDWGSASRCDEYLCQGEEPNFIADDE